MGSEFWYFILSTFLEALMPLVIAVIGYFLLKLAKDHGADQQTLTLISEAYAILARAARSTNQIYVDAIKKSKGGLTEEEKAIARMKTTETFKSMITEATKLAIETAYGSVESWIEINLESAVNEVRDV